ncbi:MAG TPA: cation-transporting P-type ATPase [Candidatus Saccharimonadales bacterium]|nr:cation-transporting P-type ATPase [Candidatus Saccharimonadales bacterium]
MVGENEVPYYRQDGKSVLAQLDSNLKRGLSSTEAAKRLEEYGPNRLQELNKESTLHKYLRQFKDLMIILLLASAFISLFLGDGRTAVVLVALVLFNTIIGFSQEFKAEQLMESLEKLVVTEAKAVREDRVVTVAAASLVPGDIVYIEEGDSVPADMRLLTEAELASNDFAMTGESNPSRKFTHAISGNVELANRHNIVFMGTTVATGHGYGVVIAAGMRTELGRIASLSAETTTDLSPLQLELNHIAGRVTQGTVILCTVLLPGIIYLGLGVKVAFLYAIAIASSIIPQGLPAEINTALARAASKLAKARALVKKLSSVETLGATTVICTDKTGTLTKNQMTVERFLIAHAAFVVNGTGYEPVGTIKNQAGKLLGAKELDDLSLFFACGAMASNAHINPPDKEHAVWYTIGDPTEGALLSLAQKAKLDTSVLDEKYPELKEFAFDSARKRMSSIRRYGAHNQFYVFVKGAPESILHRCNDIWAGGHVRKMTQKDRDKIDNENHAWATEASRNLGYAFKTLPKGTNLKRLSMDDAESGLTWLGMVGMVDPLREEVPAAMAAAHRAHINVCIVTGDYAVTAEAIARKAGLTKKDQDIIVVSGEELRQLDDARLLHLASRGGVIFSRVSPEDKLRIVDLVKANHKVVAVTGDGINDAPALKRADIGVAMGKTGTDVAKQSAEIILLDDSFSTLIHAIQQGRVIFQNIKKATLSCFTSNAAELVVNLVSLGALALFHVPLALSVMEILAIDMIAELFPIAALGWDQADGELMGDRPRSTSEHILNTSSILDLLWCGLLIGGLAFINFTLFFSRHGVSAVHASNGHPLLYAKATALTYLTIVLCQLLNILQRRSRQGLFTRYQFHNRALAIAMTLSLFCVFNIIYNPWINVYFGAGPLSAIDWLYALGAAGLFITIREVQRHANTHHSREAVLELLRQN